MYSNHTIILPLIWSVSPFWQRMQKPNLSRTKSHLQHKTKSHLTVKRRKSAVLL